MQNTQLKDNGLSRGFKLPAGYITQYQSWPAFLADACSAAGISCDITGLRAAGVSVFGTDYSKAACLPDSVEQAIWGSAADRNIGQALQKLRSLITTAQTEAEKKLTIETGSYYGGGATSKTITFSGAPRFLIVSPFQESSRIFIWVYPGMCAIANASTTYLEINTPMSISWGSKSASLSCPSNYGTHFNNSNVNYLYFAITKN